MKKKIKIHKMEIPEIPTPKIHGGLIPPIAKVKIHGGAIEKQTKRISGE